MPHICCCRYVEAFVMDNAEIERERILMMPVRERLTITEVRPIRLAGNEELFLVRAHLEETPMTYRNLRTMDGLKASVCRCAIGRPALFITWQRNPFNKMAWNEHDILSVESQS